MRQALSLAAMAVLSLPAFAAPMRVYVANSEGDNITVIDPATNSVVHDIKVSRNPHGIVASPDKKRFYVSSEGEDVLDVIDRSDDRVVRRLPLGRQPNNVAITKNGKRVYVCIRQESCVSIVDTASLERVKDIEVGRGPHNVYSTPDGKYMIATSMGGQKLSAVNVETEKVDFEIPLGGVPRPLAIDAGPDDTPRRLFVQLSTLHGFAVVDYAERKVVNKIMLPDAPAGAKPLIPDTFSHGIGISPDKKTLWVNSLLDNSVSVFSLPDLKHISTTPVGRAPDWLTFAGKNCYVSNAGSNSVSVVDLNTHEEITRIPVGKVPKRIITTD